MLGVANEAQLYQIDKALSKAGVSHITIREVDAPYEEQMTAIGLAPTNDRTKIRKILSKLSLLGKNMLPPESRNTVCGSKPEEAPRAGSSEAEHQE